jgi:putative Holliday junction resolvase
VGLAVSDETETVATPAGVLRGGAGVEARIAAAAREAGAGRILVGLAVRLDGSEGPEAASARALAERLGDSTGLPVDLWDERFTTEMAVRSRVAARGDGAPGRRREAGARRPSRRGSRAADDAAAAAVLLQSYLDRGVARR